MRVISVCLFMILRFVSYQCLLVYGHLLCVVSRCGRAREAKQLKLALVRSYKLRSATCPVVQVEDIIILNCGRV